MDIVNNFFGIYAVEINTVVDLIRFIFSMFISCMTVISVFRIFGGIVECIVGRLTR